MTKRFGFRAPQSPEELGDMLGEAADKGTPVEVMGRGTKDAVGRPVQSGTVVSTEDISGITLYEPTELVLSARAGTPVAEVERVLAENDQHLAFEPIDLGPVLGAGERDGTIGGVFATNHSGSRRILVGAARDHLLGVKCVNGRGEPFKSGGRVMKNVTGYDLSRTLAGSWGTLAVMTEVTMKVLPAPKATRTLLCFGLTDQGAVEAMCLVMGTPFEVSGTVHLQKELVQRLSDNTIQRAGQSVTAVRIENFTSSVRYRTAKLKDRLVDHAPAAELDAEQSRVFWDAIRSLKMYQGSTRPLWRISTVPTNAAKLVHAVSRTLQINAAYDWSGGLIWIETEPLNDAGAVEIRRAVAEFGGHATLMRAERATRTMVDVFQPLDASLVSLTTRLKAAFDPAGILNPGRMYPGI